eukprot:1184521-Rhodomonas_salina.1
MHTSRYPGPGTGRVPGGTGRQDGKERALECGTDGQEFLHPRIGIPMHTIANRDHWVGAVGQWCHLIPGYQGTRVGNYSDRGAACFSSSAIFHPTEIPPRSTRFRPQAKSRDNASKLAQC